MPTIDPSDVTPAAAPGIGTTVSASDVIEHSGVMTPGKYASALTSAPGFVESLKRAAIPVAGQTAGQMAGEAIGTALAPETGGLSELIPLGMGALGAGAANVATSKLPEKYGGTPGESNKAAFLWGAIPAAVGSGLTRGVGGKLASKATAATQEDADTFAKQALEQAKTQSGILAEGIQGEAPTRAGVARAGRILGAPSGAAVAPLEGEARTVATNEATDAVLGPINRMRAKLGEPIGQAYSNLKGGDQRLTPEEMQTLSDSARSVREEMIAPAPKAAAIFRRLRAAPEAEVESEAESGDQLAQLQNTIANRIISGRAPGLKNMNAAQMADIQKIIDKGETPTRADYLRVMAESQATEKKPLTYDDLRELRQNVAQRLKTAQGGDVHTLRDLQSHIDDALVDRLPENMGQLRNAYRGFIKNYGYSDINKLRAAGTPEEVGEWLFSRNPSVTNEIIRNATPEERATYKSLFAQNALTKVDPAAPAGQQQMILRRTLTPYLKSNTIQMLYGPAGSKEISDIVHMPVRRELAAKALKSPRGQKLFNDGFMQAAQKSGKADMDAARAGYQKWFDSLPPEMQETVSKVAQPMTPGVGTPALPSPQASLAERLKQSKKVYVPQFVTRYGVGAAGMAALGAAAGGGQFMERAALGFALMSGGAAGYNALMKAGGADLVAKMYASPVGRAAGAQFFKTLVLLGGRGVHELTKPDQETPNAASGR